MTAIELAPTQQQELERLISPFEHREITTDRETMLARREGADMMRELNRIQGADYTDLDARLDRLWRNGQLSKHEFTELVGEIARRGLFNASTPERNGR